MKKIQIVTLIFLIDFVFLPLITMKGEAEKPIMEVTALMLVSSVSQQEIRERERKNERERNGGGMGMIKMRPMMPHTHHSCLIIVFNLA